MTLPPGPELDRAVAEAIGWPKNRQCEFEFTGLADYENSVYRCKHCGDLDLSDLVGGETQECLPSFSTDLNHAFQAAEQKFPFGMQISLNTYEDVPATMRCSCCPNIEPNIPYDPGKSLEQTGYGTTPALAICYAILRLATRP